MLNKQRTNTYWQYCKMCKKPQASETITQHSQSCLCSHVATQALVTIVHYKHKQTISNLTTSKEKYQFATEFARNNSLYLFASYHEVAPFTITFTRCTSNQQDGLMVLEDKSVTMYEKNQFMTTKEHFIDVLKILGKNDQLFCLSNAILISEVTAKQFSMPKDTVVAEADKIVMYIEYNTVARTLVLSLCSEYLTLTLLLKFS